MSIWKHVDLFNPYIGNKFRITLDEGNTNCGNCHQLASSLKLKKVFLKREDLNPTGSFKDRSISFQLAAHRQAGATSFVISSSGNSAIAAIAYAKKSDVALVVFISINTPHRKVDRLLNVTGIKSHSILPQETYFKKGKIEIKLVKRPKSDAIKHARNMNAVNLRSSVDDFAITGFQTISYEILEQCVEVDAIFIPCSSGASTIGIYNGYNQLHKTCPPLHIVQTTKIHPIAGAFDTKFAKTKTSIANAVSDRVAHRKDEVISIIEKTKGSGWVINDQEVRDAQDTMKKHCNLDISPDAALSLAGLQKALRDNHSIKNPVLILSGK